MTIGLSLETHILSPWEVKLLNRLTSLFSCRKDHRCFLSYNELSSHLDKTLDKTFTSSPYSLGCRYFFLQYPAKCLAFGTQCMLPSHQLFLSRHLPLRDRTLDLHFSLHIVYSPFTSFLIDQGLTLETSSKKT